MKKEMTVISVVLASTLIAGILWKLPEYNLTIRWFIVDEDLYLPDKTVGIVLTNHNRYNPITVQCIELIFGKTGEWGLLWVGNHTLKPKSIFAPYSYDETIIIVRNLDNPQIFDILWKEKDYLYPSTIVIKIYTTNANYTFAPESQGSNVSPISIEK